MELHLNQWFVWFAVATGGGLVVYMATQTYRRSSYHPTGRLVVSKISHKLLFWSKVSWLQAIFLLIYIALNIFLMVLGFGTIEDWAIRSGTLAAINMILLFLGGRTSTLAELAGISLSTYYVAHHWIGRIVVVQGVLHSVLFMVGQRTINRPEIVMGSILVCIFLFSLSFMRRFQFEVFLWLHWILALTYATTSIWNLAPQSVLYPIIALSIYLLHTLHRLVRVFRSNCKVNNAFITHLSETSTIKLVLHLDGTLEVQPGSYFYLYIPELRMFQTHPFVVTWWDEIGGKIAEDANPSTQPKPPATRLFFLIEPQRGLTNRLARQHSLETVLLDGPYGVNLQLHTYQNVILVAQGIGLAGVLPYARHLSERFFHENLVYQRGLFTRRVDIFWVLEDNRQEDWASEYFSQLQLKDKGRVSTCFEYMQEALKTKQELFELICYYPDKLIPRPGTSQPLIELDDHYKFLYPGADLTVPIAIKRRADGATGNSIVVGTSSTIRLLQKLTF
jgi:hypothetical protein